MYIAILLGYSTKAYRGKNIRCLAISGARPKAVHKRHCSHTDGLLGAASVALLSLRMPHKSVSVHLDFGFASHRGLPYTSEPLGHQEHALLATHDDHAVGTLSVGLRAGSHRVTTAYTVLPPMDSPPRGAHAADEARAEEGAQLAWYTKYASDDAFVADCDMINANFGADRLLETRNFLARACVTRRSFVAFNLEDFSADVVQRATLRMVAQRFDRVPLCMSL